LIGEVVNYRYEVMEKIGEGTIFTVYKARDKMLNRLVALKMLKSELQQNKGFADSLCAGYRAASALNHPNIARVLDADNSSGACFVVCEYVRGVSIKDRVSRGGALAVPVALDIVVPVLQAMDYAHTSGMLHGNLRCQDIIVSPDGEVKVTDFGLANALASSPEVANAHVMRSVHYEAPELAEEGHITAASDVYSIGVVLYEMLTGALPYTGNTAVAVAVKRMKEPPIAPRLHNTGVPQSLSDLILKAIEMAPGSRYESVAAMQRDLLAIREAVRVGRPAAPPAASATRRSVEDDEMADYPPERSVALRLTGLVLLFVAVVVATLFLTLRFKGGPAVIEVPDFVGKTIEQARSTASVAGLTIETTDAPSDLYPTGQVVDQEPNSGAKVSRSNPVVKLTVSRGSEAVEVPRVVNLTEGEASAQLSSSGFIAGTPKYKSDETVPASYVISQEPPAGAKVAPGQEVTLTISTGPKQPPEELTPTPTPGEDENPPVEQSWNVNIKVPDSAAEPQEVKVVVDDQESAERVAYDETHKPGDKFSVRVTAKGTPVRIRVFVGGDLIEDNTIRE
jgi:eukaryotic-like serine/threonine-protein kinase